MFNLADHMKSWRKRAGLTQSKAAMAMQLPLQTYQHIEQGRDFKYAHMLILAAECFDRRAAETKAMFERLDG